MVPPANCQCPTGKNGTVYVTTLKPKEFHKWLDFSVFLLAHSTESNQNCGLFLVLKLPNESTACSTWKCVRLIKTKDIEDKRNRKPVTFLCGARRVKFEMGFIWSTRLFRNNRDSGPKHKGSLVAWTFATSANGSSFRGWRIWTVVKRCMICYNEHCRAGANHRAKWFLFVERGLFSSFSPFALAESLCS